jgi:hypothetical protein
MLGGQRPDGRDLMSASEASRAEWLDNRFWERLDLLEARHQRVQIEHESARRCLERTSIEEIAGLREAWQRYCDVIAELDRATAELEDLRARGV